MLFIAHKPSRVSNPSLQIVAGVFCLGILLACCTSPAPTPHSRAMLADVDPPVETRKPDDHVGAGLVESALIARRSTPLPVESSMAKENVPKQATRLDSRRMRQLFDAVAWVESNGDDTKVGDQGRAIGRYQIHAVYWQDARMRSGQYADVKNREYAERVMLAYWRRHVPGALDRGDFETLARVHNGGPRGATKKATEPYWRKVRERMGRVEVRK